MRLVSRGLGLSAAFVVGLGLSFTACSGDKAEVEEPVAPAAEGEAASEDVAPAPVEEVKKEEKKKDKKAGKKKHDGKKAAKKKK